MAGRRDSRELPTPLRERMERGLGRSLHDIRIRRDADREARELDAVAYTHGSEIGLRSDAALHTASGRRRLAHELIHFAQPVVENPSLVSDRDDIAEAEARDLAPDLAAGLPVRPTATRRSLISRDEDELEPGTEVEVETADPDELDLIPEANDHFTIETDWIRPDTFLVPIDASRADISQRLFGNGEHEADFDFVAIQPHRRPTNFVEVFAPPPTDLAVIRVRNADALTADALVVLRAGLDSELDTDVAHTIAKLSEAAINDADEWDLAQTALRWSQLSDMTAADGTNYFDCYLRRLHDRTLRQPHWYTLTITETSHNALDWLLIELEEKSEQLKLMIATRSQLYTTSYTVTQTRPEFAPGDVVGRFYWSTGSGAGTGIQIVVIGALGVRDTLSAAEIAARNAPFLGLRAIIPGNGRFYVYALRSAEVLGDTEIADDPGGRYFWYWPGTVAILAHEFRADAPAGSAADGQQRQQILDAALGRATTADLTHLLGLDYDVLRLMTLAQRRSVFQMAFDGHHLGDDDTVALLSRVILTSSATEFRQLERAIDTPAFISALAGGPAQSKFALGRAYTAKALEAFPLQLANLDAMPTIQVGQADNVWYMADTPTSSVSTTLADPATWDPNTSPTLDSEPAIEGETPGTTATRVAIAFRPVVSTVHRLGPLSSSTHEEGARTQNLHPLQLVRLERIQGDQHEQAIVTAFEAMCVASVPATSLLWTAVGRLAEMWQLYGITRGLALGFGPVAARGFAAAGLRGAVTELGAVAATEAGRTLLRGYAIQGLMLTSMIAVDAYRSDLQQSEAGRAFLAIYDVSMLLLVAHDVYRLASSGALTRLATAGVAALRALGGAARTALTEAIEIARALDMAWTRLRAEGALVAELVNGVRTSVPREPGRFQHLFFSARAELAAQRVVTALQTGGLASTTTESVITRLRALAETDAELARGLGSILRRAARMPAAEIDAFLAACDALQRSRPGALAAIGDLFRAAVRRGASATFLADAQWLAGLSGLSNEGFAQLAAKLRRGSLDLAWLRGTSLTPRELDFLARDSNTPWGLYRRASLDPTNRLLQIQAQTSFRGVAGEIVTEDLAARLFPGQRITGRQVRMGTSELDFQLTSTDGLGRRTAAEVKGWRGEKWRDALNAWLAPAASRTQEQVELVEDLQRMLDQLNNASTTTGNAPFLVITDALTGPTRTKLANFLAANMPSAVVRTLPEAEILAAGQRLRVGLGLPAVIP